MKQIKNINNVALIALILLFASGCNKYIDKKPLDAFSDLDYWNSESNVQTFCWGFYNDLFDGYGNGNTLSTTFYFNSFSDDQANPSFQNFTKNAPANDGDWGFGDIRKANLVINRVNIVPMDQEAKNHWAGVARFFRAMNYFQLVKEFGDVPWYSSVLDISEDSAIYKARDPRNLVMDSVLADLNFAVANLRANSGDNTVNKDVALALKSRVCLYEGTYSEYHEHDNTRAATYLQACKDASAALMNAGYTLTPNYKTVYNSESLKGNSEIVLYKDYEDGILMHSLVGYTNATTIFNGLTKSAVESYVCSDGLPIDLSTEYQGDDNIATVRTNRDKRLLETVDSFYCYNGASVVGMHSSTGYRPSKFLPTGVEVPNDYTKIPYNTTDAPLFWLGETMENYAEAAAELDNIGTTPITQNDLDISINLLRARAGVKPLQIDGHQSTAIDGVPFVDPKKDADVTSLIWEVRRDRRSELIMDGFRFDDLIRWAKLSYMDTQVNPDCILGAKVPANPSITVNADGYIMPYAAGTTRTPKDRDYLSPIPTTQISLYGNGALTQNPGW
jgi:starch-binding outer membrane protein, SusD/RagB family